MKIRPQIFSQRAKWILYPILTLHIVNLFIFIWFSYRLGGDALNGYVNGSHFFVCSHGACREVSQSIWNLNYWHGVTVHAGILVAFLLVVILIKTGDIVVKPKGNA